MTSRGSELSVDELRIATRDGGEIVKGVSFRVSPGTTTGIVGQSGSGKSLTCRALLGILPDNLEITGGGIRFGDEDLLSLDYEAWRRVRGPRIAAVFQDPASYLNPSISVGRQLAEAFRVHLGASRSEARIAAVELFERIGLRDPERVYHQYAFELSGGMLQRVLIAAAIAADPQVFIADEATTALDVTVQAEILDLIAELRESAGLAVVMVSHDLAVVAQICDEVLVMKEGNVVEHGSTADVLFRPQHEYTRFLIAEHEQYGLDRFLDAVPEQA